MAGAQVVVTDSANQTVTISVLSPSGNFAYPTQRGQPTLQFPFTAKVVYMGKERKMAAAQSSGDCNVCHTQGGTQNAPGRITLPY